MDEAKQPGLRIVQVYLSKAHFEHREDALSFPSSTRVDVKFGFSVQAAGANEGRAGLITLGIKTVDEQPALYSFQVEMTGIVEGETDAPNLSVQEYVTKTGAAMMFPFLREAVANLTSRGRFGAIYLKPFNFLTLVRQDEPEDAAAKE